MKKLISYQDYIKELGLKDCRRSWVEWKMDFCGMSEQNAIVASTDKDWGYEAAVGKQI